MKAAIIGGGNIGMALADGLIRATICNKEDITITRRSLTSLTHQVNSGFKTSIDNSEAIKNAQIVFICVLPQQLDEVLSELKPAVDIENQLFVSVVTGAHTQVFQGKIRRTASHNKSNAKYSYEGRRKYDMSC